MRFGISILAAVVLAAPVHAVEQSSRPDLRPVLDAEIVTRAATTGPLIEIAKSIRPIPRGEAPKVVPVTLASENVRFQNWIKAFRGRAAAKGISDAVLERAFAGVTYDPEVIKRDRNQSEFTKTIWDYLDSAASDARVNNGKAAVRKQRAVLDRIEAQYGVDKYVVAAIWGLESAYGTFKGSKDLVRSLATLAFDTRRGAFFEGQLIAGLRIIEAGDVSPRKMTGSWAGAMGHTQFIPTSYLDYAVDFTGDGKRDIWGENPADALASTANYLKSFGWTTGQPWGVEVRLPEGFDYTQAARENLKLPSEWAAIGIKDIRGKAVPDHGKASILIPAGHTGAAFMIFDNFEVLERYNTADAYVIGVGHLADRIKGGPKIQSGWPREDRALKLAERKELQERLTEAGFPTKVDGRIGPLTINSVRAYQKAQGLVPDGYASLAILKHLRQG